MTQYLDTLTPIKPPRAMPGFDYFTSPDGALFKARKGKVPTLVAYKGYWEGKQAAQEPEPEPAPEPEVVEPAPTAPEQPAAEPTPQRTEPTFRYSFTYSTTFDGIPGTITVQAATGAGLKLKVPEVARYFPPSDAVAAPKPEDEFFVFLADGTAYCRRHKEPMSKRLKQGDEWHSHNVGTEANPCWCRGRPGSDSPGWSK